VLVCSFERPQCNVKRKYERYSIASKCLRSEVPTGIQTNARLAYFYRIVLLVMAHSHAFFRKFLNI